MSQSNCPPRRKKVGQNQIFSGTYNELFGQEKVIHFINKTIHISRAQIIKIYCDDLFVVLKNSSGKTNRFCSINNYKIRWKSKKSSHEIWVIFGHLPEIMRYHDLEMVKKIGKMVFCPHFLVLRVISNVNKNFFHKKRLKKLIVSQITYRF